jgi:hypothetical protein
LLFEWIPNTEPDDAVLNRLKKNFPKPDNPPPIAWFMGEIDYFDEFMLISPEELDSRTLERFFSDIQGGLVNFPEIEFAQKSWHEWYFYLLPYLALRTHNEYIYGYLVTFCMLISPDSLDGKYVEFRKDMLHVIGQNLMFAQFWDEHDLSDEVRGDEYSYRMSQGQSAFVDTLSPALFFCLKYLQHDEIEDWVDSLAIIKGIHWHYHFMNWLYKAIYFLPEFDELEAKNPKIRRAIQHSGLMWWQGGLDTILLPHENMVAFVKALKKNKIFYP